MMDHQKSEADAPIECASPPCFMPELERLGNDAAPQALSWPEVLRWRKAERERLIAERLSWSTEERAGKAARIAASLDMVLGKMGGRIISSYWPFRGEPDLRNWAIRTIERGGRIALPVVIRKGWPLEFRIWTPGDPLERGVWNILVPSRGPSVQPDVVIAPVVGFDSARYRLGYGGGFFDRTLAKMPRKPFVIGVGYAASRIETIHPQPHDIPMSVIVTDEEK